MNEIILHHYPQSPVSEKVRIGLGIKKLAWRSVEIPRIPPKPDLMPLTGGYRRTPVMQIGADIYCDSQCILREIDRRHPEPTFYPGGGYGLPWALNAWTSGEMFEQAIAIVLGSAADELPPDFAADRGRLYFGPDYDLHALADQLPHIEAQLRGQFGWLDERLAHGRDFILGDIPGLPDAACYYLVWFLRGRWAGADDFFAEFPAIGAWEKRVAALGHGSPREMSARDALDVARTCTPATPEKGDERDPQKLEPGMKIAVTPAGKGGDPQVEGRLRYLDRYTVALVREDERVGTLCVHFPRVGYRVSRL
ncbi:MAG: glutathione S-transferase family protein [Alphaproteobacteria bacterium]|nr:MAG: glutathione S-transferase family protein [Alphaproteobacteria bacterium]